MRVPIEGLGFRVPIIRPTVFWGLDWLSWGNPPRAARKSTLSGPFFQARRVRVDVSEGLFADTNLKPTVNFKLGVDNGLGFMGSKACATSDYIQTLNPQP